MTSISENQMLKDLSATFINLFVMKVPLNAFLEGTALPILFAATQVSSKLYQTSKFSIAFFCLRKR